MKVRELIEQLKMLDGEINVFVTGYQGGVDDLERIEPETQVALNVNVDTVGYSGDHEADAQEQTLPYPDGVSIVRGVVF
jgi:hypothetical protein